MCIRLLASLGYCNVDFKAALKWQNCEYNDAFLGENTKCWCGFLVSCFSLFSFFIILLPLSLSAQGGYSAPSFSPWQGSFQGIPRTVPPHRRQSESVPLTHLPHCVPVEAFPLHALFIS